MESLFVIPGATPRGGKSNYILVDSKNFTLDWCCQHIPGMQFSHIEIWDSSDVEATSYAMTRARSPNVVTVRLTKSVWEDLETNYQLNGIEQKCIDDIKAMCDIVEDLDVSN